MRSLKKHATRAHEMVEQLIRIRCRWPRRQPGTYMVSFMFLVVQEIESLSPPRFPPVPVGINRVQHIPGSLTNGPGTHTIIGRARAPERPGLPVAEPSVQLKVHDFCA